MKEGTHIIMVIVPELVAAQRAFFNFCFLAPAKSVPEIVSQNIPVVIQSGQILNLTATAMGASTSGFTYEWLDVCGGSFDNPYIQSPKFTAPVVTEPTLCAITVRATDECGRIGFFSQNVTLVPAPAPPIAFNDTSFTPPYLPVDVDVINNDTDINLDPLSVSGFVGSPTIPGEGTFSINPDGTIRFTPDPTFTGTSSIDYIVCDTTSRCDTATVFIHVAYPDTDNDGITDDVDVDDDNDGILDTDYYGGTDPSADADSDGYPNYVDTDFAGFVDVNNDGVNDNFDADGDGLADHLDVDADNDGIPDAIEANGGVAPAGYSTATGTITGGVNGVGLPTAAVPGYTLNDFDGDGILDVLDLDSDNDGIVDLVEAGGTDADGDGVVDGFTDANNDGIDDAILASPLTYPNTDGTGLANFLDIDSDGDGITDTREAQATTGYISPLGIDTDGDGLDNAFDLDNGGTAIVVMDFDGDSTPDYMDTDSDNDTVLDNIEGHDANGDGISDVNACTFGTDADSDGLDDCYDTDIVTYDPLASNSPLQNTDGTVDNDWRDIDDDDDGKLTINDLGDANGNSIPDYLESPCQPGQVVLPNPQELYADTVIQTILENNTNYSTASPALGAPDLTVTGKKVKNATDILVLRMSDTIPSGATIEIYGEATNVNIRVSIDNSTWTTIGTNVDLGNNNLADFDSFTASLDFQYIEFKKGSGNSSKIDAVVGKFTLDSCVQAIAAVNDTVNGYENYDIEIDVQANDSEALGSPLTTLSYTQPSNGTIVLNNDSTFTYSPNANYNGSDSFEYIICNPTGLCDTALVYINVNIIPCFEGRAPEVFVVSKTQYAVPVTIRK